MIFNLTYWKIFIQRYHNSRAIFWNIKKIIYNDKWRNNILKYYVYQLIRCLYPLACLIHFSESMQVMGNCFLSNSESVCKFFFRLSRIFLEELLQFLVFEFFSLPRSFSAGKVKITIAKSLEPLFTRLMRHRTFS